MNHVRPTTGARLAYNKRAEDWQQLKRIRLLELIDDVASVSYCEYMFLNKLLSGLLPPKGIFQIFILVAK